MTNDAAVAWEERHRGPDGEWRAWSPCSKAYFDGYANSDNYQTRALVTATTVAELRAEVERLRKSNELYSFAMNTAGIDELKRRADAAERRVADALELADSWLALAAKFSAMGSDIAMAEAASMTNDARQLRAALTKESP